MLPLSLATLVCLLYLGWLDLRTRLLPNKWVLFYTLLFIPASVLHQCGWLQLGAHVAMGLIAFLVLLLLFIINAMGGGDVKLGAAVFLWAGVDYGLQALLITAWLGGVVAILGWLADRPALQRLHWRPLQAINHALSAQRGVPYGVALVAAALYVLWRYVQPSL